MVSSLAARKTQKPQTQSPWEPEPSAWRGHRKCTSFKWPLPQHPSPHQAFCCWTHVPLRKPTHCLLSFANPVGHPLYPGPGARPNLRGRTLLSAYLVVKVCLISSCLSLPVAGLCFYKGSSLLLGTEQSLKVPGQGGQDFALVKRQAPCQPWLSSCVASWEHCVGWGAGVEAEKGRDSPGSPVLRQEQRGDGCRGSLRGRALGRLVPRPFSHLPFHPLPLAHPRITQPVPTACRVGEALGLGASISPSLSASTLLPASVSLPVKQAEMLSPCPARCLWVTTESCSTQGPVKQPAWWTLWHCL